MLELNPLPNTIRPFAYSALANCPAATIETRDADKLGLYGPYQFSGATSVPIPNVGIAWPESGFVVNSDNVVGWTGQFNLGPHNGSHFIAIVSDEKYDFKNACNLTRGIYKKMRGKLTDVKLPDLTESDGFIYLAEKLDFRSEVLMTRDYFTRNSPRTPHFSGAITWYDIALQFVRDSLVENGFCAELKNVVHDSSDRHAQSIDALLGRMRYRCPYSEIAFRLQLISGLASHQVVIDDALGEHRTTIEKMRTAWNLARERSSDVSVRLGDDSFGNVLTGYENLMTMRRWTFVGVKSFLEQALNSSYTPWYMENS